MDNNHPDDQPQEQVEQTHADMEQSKKHETYLKVRRTIYYILGVLEFILALRLIFKLLGANPNSGFVSFIYSVSGVLIAPFVGIFRSAVNPGIETKSVLEPANIIAMLVYWIIAYGIVKLIKIYTEKE